MPSSTWGHMRVNQDEVILGVDTHLDKHVGAVISVAGKLLATQAVDTTSAGYLQLLAWARSLGDVRRAGIEGTATYGSGLTKFSATGCSQMERESMGLS